MFIPKVNEFLNITLPGELLRGVVRKVVTNNAVIVEISTEPLAKSHQYKFRDLVACRRKMSIFGEEWEVVEKHMFDMETLETQEKENAAKEDVRRQKEAAAKKAAMKKAPTKRHQVKKVAPKQIATPKKRASK